MKNAPTTPSRLYFLDWLRVLAMICIFFFHNARFYDEFSDWHVKNATAAALQSYPVEDLGYHPGRAIR